MNFKFDFKVFAEVLMSKIICASIINASQKTIKENALKAKYGIKYETSAIVYSYIFTYILCASLSFIAMKIIYGTALEKREALKSKKTSSKAAAASTVKQNCPAHGIKCATDMQHKFVILIKWRAR